MSISEEKMMILKMLQEGRINSDEAAKLLEALEEKEKDSSRGTRFGRI
ncbi:MAG: SHOCT-like domain-containing protein [Acetivibrionales bacterium]